MVDNDDTERDKQPSVPEDAGSAKDFSRGQSEVPEDETPEAEQAGVGSGRQFGKGQSPEAEPVGEPAPPGSGRQFSRGQSPVAEDDTRPHPVPEGSGKEFARGQSDRVTADAMEDGEEDDDRE
jgi:hypothetical protein